jgi:hypothetical protein
MTTTEQHITSIYTQANHGTKARRYRCSCGRIGPRIAFGPGVRTIDKATAKAEVTAVEHIENPVTA